MVERKCETRMISRWRKGNKECNLISKTANTIGKPTLWAFEGWNPLPVKGWFASSYPVLAKWLTDNGWENISNQSNTYIISCTVTETVYEIDI